MNLYLLRHAIAAEPDGITMDSQRPLTEKGRKKLQLMAEHLAGQQIRPERILSSPYLRTRQTAEVAAAAFKLPAEALQFSEHLTPDGSPEALVEEIQRLGNLQEMMLVGHEPNLSTLISILTSGRPDLQIEMKKAAICKLTVTRLKYGRCAMLNWLITPAHLEIN